jgi:hypothetical protein
MDILIADDESEDQTDPDVFPRHEVEGALPQSNLHEEVTRPWNVTEPLYLTTRSNFDRGVAHAFDVAYQRFLERMSPEMARSVVDWLKQDPSINP